MLSTFEIKQAAAALWRAEQTRDWTEPVSTRYPNADVADAYRISLAVRDLKVAAGRMVKGHKIGLTSTRMQTMCGIAEPICGAVLATRVHTSGEVLQRSAYGRLGLEFEIAVRIRSDVPESNQTAESVRRHELPTLRKFGSTGEPWNPDPWLWLFHEVGHGRLPILNYSGGTEISGGIIMGNVLSPLKPCSFAGPVPGMSADVVNENGKSIRGEVGELIIRQPWIGMTRGFWGDPQRYLETYWSRFPGVWTHGDWAAVDRDGFWYILGRSDDTIKVAGKRVGPAEVESILVNHPAVSEAAVIGLPDPLKGEALACFCVLKPGREPDDRLRDELKLKLIEDLGKTCAPKSINFVRELPKTRNAKVMRRVIRAAYLGQEPGDVSSLENPGAIEEIRKTVDS